MTVKFTLDTETSKSFAIDGSAGKYLQELQSRRMSRIALLPLTRLHSLTYVSLVSTTEKAPKTYESILAEPVSVMISSFSWYDHME